MPAVEALNFAFLDLAIHTWDLATATAQEARMDDGVVDYLIPFATLRSQQGPNPYFKPSIPLPDQAPRQSLLLALTGRRA